MMGLHKLNIVNRKQLPLLIYLVYISLILLITVTFCLNSYWSYTAPQDGMWNLPTASLLRGSSIYQNYMSPLWHIEFLNWNIPIVSSPYGGAGKSYLLAFTSLFFPTFAIANLTLNFILLFFVIFLTYCVSVQISGRTLAFISTLILLFSNGFMFAAQTDYGPILIGTSCLLLIALLYLKREHLEPDRYVYIMSFLIGGSLADKLTIFPYLLPTAIYLIIFLFKTRFKNRFKVIFLCFISFLIPLTFHLLYFLSGGWSELLAWLGPAGPANNSGQIGLLQTWNALITFSDVGFGGENPYLYRAFFHVTNALPSQTSLLICAIIILTAPIFSLARVLLSGRSLNKIDLLYFYPLIVLTITPIFSYNPWHLLPLTPFVIILGIHFISNNLSLPAIIIRYLHLGRLKFNFSLALGSIFVILIGASSFDYYANFKNVNAVGIASLDTKLIGPKLVAAKIKQITCLDYSVCLNVTANMPQNQFEIVDDYTFDANFARSGLTQLIKISSCEATVLTRSYLKTTGFFSNQLVQGNSSIFSTENFPEKLQLTQIASVTIDGEKLLAWRKSACTE